MIVAGKGKMENKFRDSKGPLLDDSSHVSGFERSQVSFILFCSLFSFVWIFYIGYVFKF